MNNDYADLNIYTTSMKLVYSNNEHISYGQGQKTFIQWNGLDKNNNKLASGVYIYVTKSGNNVSKGKLVIFQ